MIETVIAERAKTHGDWSRQSQLSHDIKRRIAQEQPDLTASQWEALEMIVVKVARIVCGDASEIDHWKDIQGYATLGGSE